MSDTVPPISSNWRLVSIKDGEQYRTDPSDNTKQQYRNIYTLVREKLTNEAWVSARGSISTTILFTTVGNFDASAITAFARWRCQDDEAADPDPTSSWYKRTQTWILLGDWVSVTWSP